jgi:GNAT superfamily N-acetyltransferase
MQAREAIGIGALRMFGPGTAEIERMYVIPEHRGAGVAKRILEELAARPTARLAGGSAWTRTRLTEANRMYREAGYRGIPDCNPNQRADRSYEEVLA